MDATNYWIRHFDNPHQPKALYLEALLINGAVAYDAQLKNDMLMALTNYIFHASRNTKISEGKNHEKK